jgi:hypothetical protein
MGFVCIQSFELRCMRVLFYHEKHLHIQGISKTMLFLPILMEKGATMAYESFAGSHWCSIRKHHAIKDKVPLFM